MDEFEQPICPMCGEEFAGPIAKPFRHTIECRWCGEPFKVDGNPEAPVPEFRRPFWTDQFRMGKEDSEYTPAGLDGVMIAIVAVFGLVIAATLVFALINPMLF